MNTAVGLLHLIRNNIYRVITAVGVLVAVALALSSQVHMTEWDDWAYYYAVQNFSHGQFTVDNQLHNQQVVEAQQQGGKLAQYVQTGDGKWALEKAPGYVFYLVPFELAGVPRYGNALLTLAMVVVTYLVLKRLRDEKAAMIGSLLMLFTPVALISLNRSYMDSYASMAFLVIGGGLYSYYHLQCAKLSLFKGGLLLFMAFLFIGWSVVTRYSNIPVAVILALHFLIFRVIAWRKKENVSFTSELLPFIVGVGLSVAVLLIYNYFIFGSPLNYGYQISGSDPRFTTKFAFQYLGEVNAAGQSIPLQLIQTNLRIGQPVLLIGFPLLFVGIPGLLVILYFKCSAFFKRSKPAGIWSSLQTEISWDLLLVLIGWFVFVFFLYLTYEFTATHRLNGLINFARYYLPGLFPVAVICALIISRLPWKLFIPVTALLTAFGALYYIQWAWNLNILPAWLNIKNGGRVRGVQ